jgi:hypothetical protein
MKFHRSKLKWNEPKTLPWLIEGEMRIWEWTKRPLSIAFGVSVAFTLLMSFWRQIPTELAFVFIIVFIPLWMSLLLYGMITRRIIVYKNHISIVTGELVESLHYDSYRFYRIIKLRHNELRTLEFHASGGKPVSISLPEDISDDQLHEALGGKIEYRPSTAHQEKESA